MWPRDHASGGGRDMRDFGDDFVERERRYRHLKSRGGPPSRAKSEVAEILAYGANGRHQRAPLTGRVRPGTTVREEPLSTRYYERPRSSFEPATASSRVVRNRGDDWLEVERKSMTGADYSSGGEDDVESELDAAEDDNDSREEMSQYMRGGGGDELSRSGYAAGGRPRLTDADHHFLSYLRISPLRMREILEYDPPPELSGFYRLTPLEKAAFVYYYTLYKQWLPSVEKFKMVFNREFYKLRCEGFGELDALEEIRKRTEAEWKWKRAKENKRAYERSRKHLFSDERATPDSRASDRPSNGDQVDDSDLASVDSISKEPLKFRVPHAFLKFAVGGRVIVLNPESSVSTVRIEDLKTLVRDRTARRNIEALESFKGPLVVGETQPHTPLLFIQRQIDRILRSDVYNANPQSGDANDCLLIWRLLEILVRQQGRVTGPNLAQLLTSDYSYSSMVPTRGRATAPTHVSSESIVNADERVVDPHAMDRMTQYLLGGHIDEAIDTAIQGGLLFDALIVAYRLFRNDRRKLDQIEARLLAHRPAQHPTMTLISVAADLPVPLLTNTTAEGANGWRAHIAIVLANLHSQAAMNTVYQLGLALSQKEFHSAADFCFLAVNLLTGYDCFRPVEAGQEDEHYRKHISLINASLPDDEAYSTDTRFGWSLLNYQATEIYDYALKLASNGQTPSVLSASIDFQRCRLQYAQLLAEYGGGATSAADYCTDVARAIWGYAASMDRATLETLCDLADRLRYMANRGPEELAWVEQLRAVVPQAVPQPYATATATSAAYTTPNTSANTSLPNAAEHTDTSTPIMFQPPPGHHEPPPTSPHGSVRGGRQRSRLSESTITDQSFNYERTISPERSSVVSELAAPHQYHQYEVASGAGRNGSSEAPRSPVTPVAQFQDAYVAAAAQRKESLRHTSISESEYENDNMGYQQDVLTPVNVSPPQDQFFTPAYSPPQQSSPGERPVAQRQMSRERSNSLLEQQAQQAAAAGESRHQQLQAVSEQQQQEQQGAASRDGGGGASAGGGGGGGLFGGLKTKLAKMIPTGNEMKLPDDSKKSIYFDPQLGRWVGDGVEEEHAPAPPPIVPVATPNTSLQVGSPAHGQTAPANTSGMMNGSTASPAAAPSPNANSFSLGRRSGHRYAQAGVFGQATSSPAAAPVLPPSDLPPVPSMNFGFIPVQQDTNSAEEDGGDPSNPFAQAAPVAAAESS